MGTCFLFLNYCSILSLARSTISSFFLFIFLIKRIDLALLRSSFTISSCSSSFRAKLAKQSQRHLCRCFFRNGLSSAYKVGSLPLWKIDERKRLGRMEYELLGGTWHYKGVGSLFLGLLVSYFCGETQLIARYEASGDEETVFFRAGVKMAELGRAVLFRDCLNDLKEKLLLRQLLIILQNHYNYQHSILSTYPKPHINRTVQNKGQNIDANISKSSKDIKV